MPNPSDHKKAEKLLSENEGFLELDEGENDVEEDAGAMPLENAKHEKFCQMLADGSSQREAYSVAMGAVAHGGNTSRLARRPHIEARVAWLKREAQSLSAFTKDNIRAQLGRLMIKSVQAIETAENPKAADINAAKGVIELMAKFQGHLVEESKINMTLDQLFDQKEIAALSDSEAANIKSLMQAAVLRSVSGGKK